MNQHNEQPSTLNREERIILAKCYAILLEAAQRKRDSHKQTTDRGEFGDLTRPADREPDSNKSDR